MTRFTNLDPTMESPPSADSGVEPDQSTPVEVAPCTGPGFPLSDRARNLEPEDLTPDQLRALRTMGTKAHFVVGQSFRPRGSVRFNASNCVRFPTAAHLVGYGLAELDGGRLQLTLDGLRMRRRIEPRTARRSR